MKLLMVSDMPHYKTTEGQIVGWGPTVEEIDHLAALFDEVRHIGFLYPGVPPNNMLPYQSAKVQFIPLSPSGGSRFVDKLGILAKIPSYLAKIFHHLPQSDILHIRCPSNVGLLLIVFLPFMSWPKYRWIKYAGNWRPDGPEDRSYTFQRWWLNLGLHRGAVTVNGRWPDQPMHVYSFLNPSLVKSELENARQLADSKKLNQPLELLFVGRVEEAKGVGRLLQIASRLEKRGINFRVEIVGDSPERAKYEAQSRNLGLADRVIFHGWLPHSSLAEYYARAHFFVLPSTASEGWPKVLSEAMAFGVVPLAGALSSIPQILNEFKVGLALPPEELDLYAQAFADYLADPERWHAESRRGMESAPQFTYETHLQRVQAMMKMAWGIEVRD